MTSRAPNCRYPAGSAAARETELIFRIAQGDRLAFEELYNLYHHRLARFLTRLTSRHDRHDIAEEVINDTFAIVWRKACDFRGDSRLSTWILGIAYHKARNAFCSSVRAGTAESAAVPLDSPESHEPTRAEELRDWLIQALGRLPLKQRLAVELCYGLGYSCEEISAMMDCPVNTVKTRLFHARAKLQKLLPALAGSGWTGQSPSDRTRMFANTPSPVVPAIRSVGPDGSAEREQPLPRWRSR